MLMLTISIEVFTAYATLVLDYRKDAMLGLGTLRLQLIFRPADHMSVCMYVCMGGSVDRCSCRLTVLR